MGAKRGIRKDATRLPVEPPRRTIVNPRAKRWVFTWNNPPDTWKETLESFSMVSYMIAEVEFAPSTGTKHIQGYIRFDERVYKNTLMAKTNCFWDIARGSELDNYKYCTKYGGEHYEYGEMTMETQLYKSKEDKMKQMLSNVMTMKWEQFEDKYPIQAFYHQKRLENYKISHMKVHNDWPGQLEKKNYWIWGPPGTGKSHWARTKKPLSQIYPKMCNKWWDSFRPGEHTLVIFEDFPSDGRPFAQLMKIWSDRYSFIGEVKNGEVMIDPGTFNLIVTSNYSIDTVFPGDDGLAIRRRFKEIEVKGPEDLNLQRDLEPLNQ
ncbi:Rep [Histomonas meleagridis]|nr:Rep [Histomonas meleagridis]